MAFLSTLGLSETVSRKIKGRTVVLECRGMTLILRECKMPTWSLRRLQSLGIEPKDVKLIVNKSAFAFRAAYEPIAKQIIEVDTPGLAANAISTYPYNRIHKADSSAGSGSRPEHTQA